MTTKDAQMKILAQVLYDIRILLSRHLGSRDKENASEAVAAHLAYALHNDAMAIIENRPEDFDIADSLEKIRRVDEKYGEQLSLLLNGEQSSYFYNK